METRLQPINTCLHKLSSGNVRAMNFRLLTAIAVATTSAFAQETDPEQLPATIVTAQKEPGLAQVIPLSITAVDRQTLDQAAVYTVKDASLYSPNTYMAEFTARFLSNPRFRGVGSSPNNPGITTYYDGVPQLNANSSSLELIDVDQVEFVRGAQGALFGRNTIGGIINVSSRRPTMDLTSGAEVSYGNHDYYDARFRVSGPIVQDQAAASVAIGYSSRDGYTRNTLTGRDVDDREAYFGKAQFLLQASENFDLRLILAAETADDGDFALGDLASLRQNPHEVSRDFEGFTSRDVIAPTLLGEYRGERVKLSSISGFVWWTTEAQTDLDYTPAPLITRDNDERQHQFTQEFRLASAEDAPVDLGENLALRWQSGVFLFSQDYDQATVNNLSPLVTGAPFPVQDSSLADLRDLGMGLYAQGKLTFLERWDLLAGARYDYENKEADLRTATTPPVSAPTDQNLDDDFDSFSPQVGLAWRPVDGQMLYAHAAAGFKAGGFNPISPGGSESYDQEKSWNYELGYKCTWLDGKLLFNVAVFYIDWADLQLNVPVVESPGRFYVANVGDATSRGVELETRWRATRWLDLFGSAGYTDAEFGAGSTEGGLDIGGNTLPYTPEFTGNVGAQVGWQACEQARLYARGEVTVYGDFAYDSANMAGQDTYSLANFRLGVEGNRWFVEGWINNAFDTEYIPMALPFSTAFAPSGYVGESGAPVTYGLRAGLNF